LAWRGKRAHAKPARLPAEQAQRLLGCAEFESMQRDLPFEALKGPVQHVAFTEPAMHAPSRVQRERLRLTQRQQAERVIQITVGQHDALNRRVALRAWMQLVKAFDLLPNFRRGVEQEPGIAVGAHCY